MRMLLWLLVGYIAYRVIKSLLANREKTSLDRTTGTETFQDPVCGVYLTADDAVVGKLEDKKIYFCSMGCLEKYREQLQTENHQ